MAFEPAPFDVVEASRRVWLERWNDQAASGMAVFTAILRSHQLLSNEIDAVMRRHDLTFARYEVLMLLTFTRTGQMPLGKIGQRLQVHPASVTNVIDRLEVDGLVRRRAHPTDQRTTLASITAKGRRVAAAATEVLNADVFAHVGPPPDQLVELFDALTDLRRAAGDFDFDAAPAPAAT